MFVQRQEATRIGGDALGWPIEGAGDGVQRCKDFLTPALRQLGGADHRDDVRKRTYGVVLDS